MYFVKLDKQFQPQSTEVFLDTSIHCCFHKGGIIAPRLKWLLGLFKWKGSSTYSAVEYGNVILGTAIYYLRQIKKFKSVKRVHEHISHVLPAIQHERHVWAFSLMASIGATEADRTRRVKALLRRLIKTGTNAIQARSDSPLSDGTKCVWGKTGLQEIGRGEYAWKTPNCKRDNPACKIDQFFVENREVFESIKDAIDHLDKSLITVELTQFSQVISQALVDPKILLDYMTGCKLLADATIAVDSIKYKSFATQNFKESAVLTRVLGQTCFYLPNNPERATAIVSTEHVPGAEPTPPNSTATESTPR
jgi:hypothetical protein